MSVFHGGFWVERVDAHAIEPIRRAVRDYLFANVKEAHEHSLAFTTRRGAPVLHVAVRGRDADGKGYGLFHAKHAALGGLVARAAQARVHAYHYEDQAGSEGVTTFDAIGAAVADEQASWDDVAEALGLDPEDDSDLATLFAALPLGKLAEALGTTRGMLVEDIPYDTPSFRVSIVGDVSATAFDAYLASAPSVPAPRLRAWTARTVYFPASWAKDLEGLAARLGVATDEVLHAAWESEKEDLWRSAADLAPGGETVDEAPARPEPSPPPRLVLPEGVGLTDVDAPDLPAADEKASIDVAMPPACWSEVGDLAAHVDRSQSFLLQRAYRLARPRLFAATTR